MGIKCNIFKNDFGEVDYTLDQNGNKSKLFNDASKVFSKEKALDVWALAYTDKFKEVYDRAEEPTLNEVVMFMEANKERLPLEQQEVTDFRLSMVGTAFTDSYELARQLKSAFLPVPTKKSLKSLGMYSDAEIKNILKSTYLQNKIVDNAFRLSNADIIYNDIEVDERIVSVDNTTTDVLGKAKNNNPLEEESVLINEVGGIKDEQEFKDKLIADFPQVDNTVKQVVPKPATKVNKTTAELVTKYLQERGVDISVLPEAEMNKLANNFGFNNFNAMVEAWHGSPHSFDRFTTNAIGTGEGVQAFGWGLYFTDLESIARNYAETLGGVDVKIYANGKEVGYGHPLFNYQSFFTKSNSDANSVLIELKEFQKLEEGFPENSTTKARKKAIAFLEKSPKIKVEANRNLYKVSLHKGKTPSEYTWLEWDKPVSEEIYNQLNEVLRPKNQTGSQLYKSLSETLGGDKNASEYLLDLGIDGIKYPAESISRGATSDTARGFNYVVFDENVITVEERIQFLKDGDKIYGFYNPQTNKIYLTEELLTSENLVHEMYHSFAPLLKEKASSGDKVAQSVLSRMKELSLELLGGKGAVENRFKNSQVSDSNLNFSAIREIGLKNSVIAMENLNLAKQMQSENKDAKVIKIATGWELGGDGKWRQEVEDLDFNTDTVEVNKEYKLSDIVVGEQILKAYPQLKNVKIKFEDNGVPGARLTGDNKYIIISTSRDSVFGGKGEDIYSFLSVEKQGAESRLHKLSEMDRRSLVHETMHFIQYEEGFAKGGSTSTIIEEAFRISKANRESKPEVLLKSFLSAFKKETDEQNKTILASAISAIEGETYKLHETYKKLAGKVEARNIEARLNMSLKDRAETLMSETEDVAEEDKIYLQPSNNLNFSIGNVFEKWKGDNELVESSEIQDVKTGQPIVAKVYHGTTNEFYEFDSSVKGNIEGHLGKVNYFTSDYGDANQNYLAEGADITGRIDRRAEEIENELESEYGHAILTPEELDEVISNFNLEEDFAEDDVKEIGKIIAERELKGTEEKVLELYVKLNNPVVLGNGATWFDALEIDDVYLEEATQEIAEEYGISEQEAKDEYDYEIRDRAVEKQGDGNKVVEALEKALDDNGYDSSQASEILGDKYYETEVDLDKLEQDLRKAGLYDNYDGEMASSQVIADFFKNLGFDGIILTDVSQRFRNMGLGEGTSHIHVFDEFNNQIKLADGSNVTFGETSDIRFSVSSESNYSVGSDYYSNAEYALNNLKDKNPKNIKGWISQLTDTQKNGGIKNVNQELEWIGLEDYLNDYVKENNPKAGNIPSSVVEDYIKSNQIEIVDVSKGTLSDKQKIEKEKILEQLNNNGEKLVLARLKGDKESIKTLENEEKELFEKLKPLSDLSNSGITKYSGYQLKGAENYREVLLTMPSKRTDITEALKVVEDVNLGFIPYESVEATNARKLIEKSNLENQSQYKSSHWDEANILAHVRLNEKTLPDGRRVLILNEIQSDWNQQGKKEGFKTKLAINEEFGYKELPDGYTTVRRPSDGKILLYKGDERLKAFDNRDDVITWLENKGVPLNPFSKTDQWVGLATRRVLQMAAQEGYDGVSFATGQQSADMYSLSQQVDKININPQGDIKAVYISMKNNADDTVFINQEGVITESASGAYNGKQAEEVLGKDLTRKILETTEETTLEGEGLEFGGEGMKTFYDKIVPKVVQKEAQRFDKNVKIETVDFGESGTANVYTLKDVKEIKLNGRSLQRYIRNAEGTEQVTIDNLQQIIMEDMFDLLYRNGFESIEEARNAATENDEDGLAVVRIYDQALKDHDMLAKQEIEDLQIEYYETAKGEKDKLSLGVQPYIAITDKMRSELKPAIPLFSVNNGLLKSEVYNPRPGETLEQYEERLIEEASAILLQNNSIEYFEKIAKENGIEPKSFIAKIKDFIKSFSSWLIKQLGLTNVTPEQLATMTQKELFDRITTSMLRGDYSQNNIQQAINRNNGNPLNLAPNGKPSILYQSYKDLGYSNSEVEKLVAQVYSDSFLDFFGDWLSNPQDASKVVDSNGQPLVVYHGSMNSGITEFLKSYAKKGTVGTNPSGGFYFTSSKDNAEFYANPIEVEKEDDFLTGDDVMVYGDEGAYYLTIGDKLNTGVFITEEEAFEKGLKIVEDYNNADEGDIVYEEDRIYPIFLNLKNVKESIGDFKQFRKDEQDIKNENGDGVIGRNILDGSSISDIFVAFEPNQIKSATENIGTFSTESNDIRFSVKPLFEKFKDFTKVNEKVLVDGVLTDKTNSASDLIRMTLQEPKNNDLENALSKIDNISPSVWNSSLKQVKILLEDISEKAVEIGLDLSQLVSKEQEDVLAVTRSLSVLLADINERNLNNFISIYDEVFELNSPKQRVVKTDTKKSVIYFETSDSLFKVFKEHGLLKVKDNVWQKTTALTKSLNDIYEDLYYNLDVFPQEIFFTNKKNKELIIEDIKNYVNSRLNEVDTFDTEYDKETLEKFILFSQYFKSLLQDKRTELQVNKYSANISNEEANYLKNEFIQDFRVEQLKNKGVATYDSLEITDKGIQIKETSIVPLEEILKIKNLKNYFLLNKNTNFAFDEELMEDRDLYVNYPSTLERYKGNYNRLSKTTIQLESNQLFVNINGRVYEKVDSDLFEILPQNTSDFVSLGNVAPKLSTVSSIKKSKAVQQKEIKNLYSKKVGEEISNQIDNCK